VRLPNLEHAALLAQHEWFHSIRHPRRATNAIGATHKPPRLSPIPYYPADGQGRDVFIRGRVAILMSELDALSALETWLAFGGQLSRQDLDDLKTGAVSARAVIAKVSERHSVPSQHHRLGQEAQEDLLPASS
jgi:hypothetical protein